MTRKPKAVRDINGRKVVWCEYRNTDNRRALTYDPNTKLKDVWVSYAQVEKFMSGVGKIIQWTDNCPIAAKEKG